MVQQSDNFGVFFRGYIGATSEFDTHLLSNTRQKAQPELSSGARSYRTYTIISLANFFFFRRYTGKKDQINYFLPNSVHVALSTLTGYALY